MSIRPPRRRAADVALERLWGVAQLARARGSFVAPLGISAILVAPFMVLQAINRRTFHEEFPFVLFTFMSVHALFIALLLTPTLRRLRADRSLTALTLGHWAGLLLGAFLVSVYAAVVIDQVPCFLGVPNCD